MVVAVIGGCQTYSHTSGVSLNQPPIVMRLAMLKMVAIISSSINTNHITVWCHQEVVLKITAAIGHITEDPETTLVPPEKTKDRQ